jgi:hypothetical protein
LNQDFGGISSIKGTENVMQSKRDPTEGGKYVENPHWRSDVELEMSKLPRADRRRMAASIRKMTKLRMKQIKKG